MRVIDTYIHVGLPRFMSAEECLKVMDDNGVEAAIAVGAETCPDLKELSRAALGWPGRFKVVGMPLGRTPQEVADGIKAQLESGFMGIRLPAQQLVKQPDMLELLGEASAVPYVMGPDVFGEAAGVLADFLERYPSCVAVGSHFAGLPSVEALEELPLAHRLLGHERFLIAFSRHGSHEPGKVSLLAKYLVKAVGWERLMYASEYPVCLWRDESYQSTLDWIDQVGLTASEAQRRAFFRGNGEKHLFIYRERPLRKLDPRWDQMPLKKASPVWLFPPDSIDLPEQTHRTIFLNYLSRGGDKRMPYSRFIAGLLTDAARRMEG